MNRYPARRRRLARAVPPTASPACGRPPPRPAAGPHRRRPLRPAGRGVARHARVLHLAGAHQPAADRGEGLLVHRRRGRLARLLPRQPLRQGRPRRRRQRPRGAARLRAAGRPGCGPTRRSSSWPSGCGGTTTAGRSDRRSASTAWTSTACGTRSTRSWATSASRPRGLAGGPARLPLLRAVTARTLQEYARATRLGARVVRGRGRRPAGASCAAARPAPAPRDGREAHFNAEQNALVAQERRGTTTARWSAAGRSRGTSATATWPRRWSG